MTEIETHPFPAFLPKNAKHLILGTFPTHKRNWKFEFYYPGRNNFFWRLMGDVYDKPFLNATGEKAIEERRKFLEEKGIAIYDVIYSLKRKVALSSKDSDLEVVEPADILKLLKQLPKVKSVILTSSSGDVSAHKLFFAHLFQKGIPFTINETKPPIFGSFIFEGREIKTATLYSTSGTNIGRYALALQQYKNVLVNK